MTHINDGASNPENRSARNVFAALTIDRASRRRRDDVWVAAQVEARESRFLPVWGEEVLVTDESPPRPGWLGPDRARDLLGEAESVILLGEDGDHAYFALGLPVSRDSLPGTLARIGTFRRLRTVAALLDGQAASMLAYAKALVHYHHHHRFCGRCGAPTMSAAGGQLRQCTNPACGQQDFPRTDPAIIVLVSSGDRCLLGRQPTWPEHYYSIIAGFVEPGETLEAAVVREVKEETGIRVRDVQYHSSQPWPFPRSLMMGFTATAETTAIRLHDGELEEARWLSRDDIVRELKQGTLQLPSLISISHRLIETWFDADGSRSLKQLLEQR